MRKLGIIARNATRSLLPFIIASLLLGCALIPVYEMFDNMYATGDSGDAIGFVDEDGTATSAAVKDYCVNDLHCNVTTAASTDDLNKELLDSSIVAVVTVPKGFEAGILAGSTDTPLQETYMQGYENQAFLQAYLDAYTSSLQVMGTAAAGNATQYHSMLTNLPSSTPQLTIQQADTSIAQREADNQAFEQTIGFFAAFAFMVGIGLALSLIDDRENGIYDRVRLASVRSGVYVAGVCIAGMIMTLAMVVPFLVFIAVIGRASMFHLGELIVLSVLYSLFSVGFSLLIGICIKSRNGVIAVIVGAGVVLSMLGGLFWPISLAPQGLQDLGHFIPQFWFVNATNGFADGSGNWLMSSAIIALFALLMFILSAGIRAVRSR
jgi:ABC-2 type transport system permease protein